MITLQQLLQAFQTTLTANATFLSWCTTNLGGAPLVQIGEDAQAPLGENDAPAIILQPGSDYARGQEVDTYAPTIAVDWVLVEDGITTSGNKRTYDGLILADQFGEAILTAIKTTSANIALSRIGYTIDPIITYPLFEGGMDIQIDIPHTMGADITL